MKIVIAPDSFKGSLTALEVANAIEEGLKKYDETFELEKVPMADGGEGTVESLVSLTNGEIITVDVKDPLMREIKGFYGLLGDKKTAVIEMAAASGLPLLKENEKNPLITSTYGTGQLIKDALDRGCNNFIIGIGGSATNDGGTGMLKALGVKFLDENNNEVKDGAIELDKLLTIDMSGFDKRIFECDIKVACDVQNPLCGENGASYVFGAQKGADEELMAILDKNLYHYGEVLEKTFNTEVINVPGAGAAGGMGAAFIAVIKGKLERGIDIIIQESKLNEKLENADLVFTGEGKIDFQTKFGKTPFGVASEAKKKDIPVIALAGSVGEGTDTLYEAGFDGIFSIMDSPMTLEEAIKDSENLVKEAAYRIINLYMAHERKVK
ncbi:glycerate kinase [Clostridium sp. SHJSY1]|uniref:glycerate kinase family protein n=1 Tax=Clostridium sp. SHJSY1 TaxID=2942483 RepID=UPI002874993D|nr:glycerate kinase [Clostridium sp. SHJSY1]MDS0527118.1 glycerate kinase [Clostridium sp. SHJSY1]